MGSRPDSPRRVCGTGAKLQPHREGLAVLWDLRAYGTLINIYASQARSMGQQGLLLFFRKLLIRGLLFYSLLRE